MCFYVRNLGGSVVSDCGDTRTASGQLGYVLGVGDTQPMLFCWSPNIDSVVNVCIDRAEEGSCVVSNAHGLA